MTRKKAGSQAFAMTGWAIDEPPVKLKRKIYLKRETKLRRPHKLIHT